MVLTGLPREITWKMISTVHDIHDILNNLHTPSSERIGCPEYQAQINLFIMQQWLRMPKEQMKTYLLTD